MLSDIKTENAGNIKKKRAFRRLAASKHIIFVDYMVAVEGLEPPTQGL